MLSFSSFLLEEAQKKTLTVFDIDDTLFTSSSKVRVMKDGKLVRELSPLEYNDDKLQPDEEYDYSEFRSAEKFSKTAQPIDKMLDKARNIISLSKSNESRVILVTARADFDDKKKIIDIFKRHGIDIKNDVYLERAGNLNLGAAAKNKKYIIHKHLRRGGYNKVNFFDDSMKNITMFKSLNKEYPEAEFKA